MTQKNFPHADSTEFADIIARKLADIQEDKSLSTEGRLLRPVFYARTYSSADDGPAVIKRLHRGCPPDHDEGLQVEDISLGDVVAAYRCCNPLPARVYRAMTAAEAEETFASARAVQMRARIRQCKARKLKRETEQRHVAGEKEKAAHILESMRQRIAALEVEEKEKAAEVAREEQALEDLFVGRSPEWRAVALAEAERDRSLPKQDAAEQVHLARRSFNEPKLRQWDPERQSMVDVGDDL